MAERSTNKLSGGRTNARDSSDPPQTRLRVKLVTAEDCRRELAKLYRETRAKRLDVADASRMANILQILSRLIEVSEFDKRLEMIEEELRKERGR